MTSLFSWAIQSPRHTGLVLTKSPTRSARSALPTVSHIDPSTGIGHSSAVGPPVAAVPCGNRIPQCRDLF
ncbi:hypothetical protein T10_7576 [Trichinella papuae]|uniref:Uncharacterized protein n=1 Tax=Trichinella papuae TaxID=268474 RepID=A0A0V1MVG2_9BILA|nr:hypothetical protein T10_7576 [Trichinella papuae]